MRLRSRHVRMLTAVVAIAAAAAVSGMVNKAEAAAPNTVSPSNPSFSYTRGPFTNLNVGGLLVGSCDQPSGCDTAPLHVNVPASYYQAIRRTGGIGAVEITMTWTDNANDFDLSLLDKDGNVKASSGFGNSDFEKIVFAELPSGDYTLQATIFRVINTSYTMNVKLTTLAGGPTAATEASPSQLSFTNGAPASLERSSGEPSLTVNQANGDLYADIPLGAPTNSLFMKSTDGGKTWLPLAETKPNNDALPGNAAGGGDSQTAVGSDGRVCISELNTLISLGVSCSPDGGRTFGPASQVQDPTTPLVDRQWQAATGDGQQYISAQFGIITAGVSAPGIRVFGDNGTGVFVQKLEVDSGQAMKSYTMVADPSAQHTLVQAYLRSNQGADKAANPHQLMIWRSTDGANSAKRYVVRNLPTTPGNNFASVAMDRAGNVYVAWSEQGTWDIYYSMVTKASLNATPDNGTPAWTTPVRVNMNGPSATSIQPTIKVGDVGRVFIGFYGSSTIGNPDDLGNGTGQWNAFLSVSTNGACQVTSTCGASGRPSFKQAQLNEHPVQFGGICLGGTGCGGDPYYGDRSMLEFLSIAFDPTTGAARVIFTDSSLSVAQPTSTSTQNTVITVVRQASGPSAYAGKPAVHDPGVYATSITDPSGDAGFPTYDLIPKSAAPGADITKVALSLPNAGKVLRATISLRDAAALDSATVAGKGKQLFIGVRFATHDDVFWMGWTKSLGQAGSVGAGHLDCGLVCGYVADSTIHATSTGPDPATNTLTIDVPVADLTTALLRPAGQKPPVVQAFTPNKTPLWSVTGYSFAAATTAGDTLVNKNPLDVTPSFTFTTAAQRTVTGPPTGGSTGKPTGSGRLATTGLPVGVTVAALFLVAGAVLLRRRAVRS